MNKIYDFCLTKFEIIWNNSSKICNNFSFTKKEKSLIVIEHGRCALFDCPFVICRSIQTNKTESEITTHSHAYKEQQHSSRKYLTEKQTGNQKSK